MSSEEISPADLEKIVAERDQARAELKATRQMLQMVMDNLPQLIYWKNTRLEFLGCNKLFADQFGVENPEDMIGKTDESFGFGHGEFVASFFRTREFEVMQHGIPQYDSIEEIDLKGEIRWFTASHIPLFNNGEIIGVLGSYQDITDRVLDERELREHRDHLSELVQVRTAALEAANEELAEANKDLEYANKAKSEFVTNISHEIRTPLNAVVAMTELMLDTQVSAVQQEYLTTTLDSADSLLFTINDLLDYSKIEAGKLDVERLPFNLRETIESSMKSLAVKAFQKNLEMLIDIDPALPAVLKGDPLRVRQVLVNLVGNALKFTSSGEIEVKLRLNTMTDSCVDVLFTVSDTGIGIPKDRQEVIFHAFEQADSSTTRNYGGTGLGLAIVSQLVELMNGEISLSSTVGVGTTFSYNLVFDVLSETKVGNKGDPVGEFCGKTAWIVDDNRSFIESTTRHMERWGMEVYSFENLDEFDQHMSASNHLAPPSLLLVDSRIHLENKVMNSVREAKKRFPKDTLFLFSIAGGEVLKRIEADAILFDSSFIFKPIADNSLANKLRTLFDGEGPLKRKHSKRALANANSKTYHVLFVDDRKLNQKIGRSLLVKFGHTVDFANNGVEAVQMIERKRYDVVLMDIQMPLMDGYEATKVIREREKNTGERLPIIAVTANVLKGESERTLKAGMDSYIPKPIRSEQLKSTIDAVMKQYSL